jgi:long-chain fatty acid transport protein
MFSLSPSTRIGIAYRSSIDYNLEGSVAFSGAPAANANASADLRTPESVSLSFFTALDPKWDVMGDVTWTRWSRIKSIVPTCQQASAVVCVGGAGTPVLGAGLPTEWKDTWRVSLGANYKYNSQWKLRMGIAYDPTPTNDAERTARLPDQDRFWVAVGAQYAVSRQGRLEFAYAHEFVRDARVNTQVFGTGFRQVGHFEDRADILTIAYSHSF